MRLIDAHCHLANLNDVLPLDPLLGEARGHGIIGFLSNALRKTEIAYYSDHPNPAILFSAGIHPNFPPCDLEPEDIIRLCESKAIWAIGEIGLDRNNLDLDWQTNTLIYQLDIAEKYGFPVVLHIVGHQQAAYNILRRFNLRYLVHGYAGSREGFSLLAKLDSVFTLSERLLRADKLPLLREMVAHGAYLLESDITQYYVRKNEPNPLLRLVDLYDRAKALTGISGAELEKTQNRSLERLGVCFGG